MKYLLLFMIRLYWLIPASKRKKCIFKESCSNYVWRITKEKGLIAGIKAFLFRNKHCCPGFAIYRYQGHYEIKTINGLIIKEEDIDKRLLNADNPSLIDFDGPNIFQSAIRLQSEQRSPTSTEFKHQTK
ncbi:MAG: membrane protein insertion efficiency factor YidD [Bacteroidetes bacterium]|uniref:Membrane protein insertion efficiency factor YidD n=1 Tax=Candidatus Gallipaludibacter merdavium TaxID=2840839 RepID=A0A9D9HRM2_9BACT|nr:membrane protein insertion efficiency factor YidD [Candidatus Gallipaludibacter merdavium]